MGPPQDPSPALDTLLGRWACPMGPSLVLFQEPLGVPSPGLRDPHRTPQFFLMCPLRTLFQLWGLSWDHIRDTCPCITLGCQPMSPSPLQGSTHTGTDTSHPPTSPLLPYLSPWQDCPGDGHIPGDPTARSPKGPLPVKGVGTGTPQPGTLVP